MWRRAGHLSATAGKNQSRRQFPFVARRAPRRACPPSPAGHAGVPLLLFWRNQDRRRRRSRQHAGETPGLRIHPERLPRTYRHHQRTIAPSPSVHFERKTTLLARDRRKRSEAQYSLGSSARAFASLFAKSDCFHFSKIRSSAHQQRRACFLALFFGKYLRLQMLRPSASRHGGVL